MTPSQRSELNYEHALEKLGWLDRLKRKAMSAGKDSSGPNKRRDAPVNTSMPTEPHKQPAAETSVAARVDQQSSTPDVNANKSSKLPRWTESMKHVTGVGSLIKPKSPSVDSGRTFLSQPSPLTSSSSDSLSTSRLKMEARKDLSPLEKMQKAKMQTGMPNRPSHLRGGLDVNAPNSERDDPFVEASSATSSTAPPTDANVLPWNYQKPDGSFNTALLGVGGSSNASKYTGGAASKGDFPSSPKTPYTPTRSSNQALRTTKSETSIKSTSSLGIINPPSKKSLEYSIENPDHMPHTHFYKVIQAPPSPPPRALSPAEDPEWPRMVAQARRNIEMREQKAAQEAEEARIAALEKPAADERKAQAEMEERLIKRGSGFGMAPVKNFLKMTSDELKFYSKELTAELERMAAIAVAEDEAFSRGDFRFICKNGVPTQEQVELQEARFRDKVIFLRDQGYELYEAQIEVRDREYQESNARMNRQIGETSRQKNAEASLSSPTAEAETTTPPTADPAPNNKKPVGLGIANAYGGLVGHADGAAAGRTINKGKGRALEPTPDSTLELLGTQGDLSKTVERERSGSQSSVSSIHSDEARELETALGHDRTRDRRVSLLSPLDQTPLKVTYRPVIEEGQGEGSQATTAFKVDRNEDFKAKIAAEAAKRARMLNAPGAPIHPALRQGSLPSTDQESFDGTSETTSKPTAPIQSSRPPRVGSLVINTDRLFSPDEEYRSPLEDHAWFSSAAKDPASIPDASVAPAIPPKSSKRTITSYRSGDQVNIPALASIVEKDDSGSEWVQNTDYDPRGDPHHALFEEDWYPGKDSAEASSSVYSRDDKESLPAETNEGGENESKSYGGMNINFDAEIQEIEEWTTPSSQNKPNSPTTQGPPPSNPDSLNALRADLDLAPLRLHDAASGQPKHPHHEFAFGTEKLMYYMKHNNVPGEAVSRCSHCARFCCSYAENVYASGLPTRIPSVEYIQQQAVKAVNRLNAEHPNGIETFDVFLSCAECSKVVCPQCVVVCEEVFCREMLCGEHAVGGRCGYHGRE